MYIESIELKNYRNYNSLALEFDKGTNIFYGDNAQGKTNILEAAYLCSTTKSNRGRKEKENKKIYIKKKKIWMQHYYAVPRIPTVGVRTKK